MSYTYEDSDLEATNAPVQLEISRQMDLQILKVGRLTFQGD